MAEIRRRRTSRVALNLPIRVFAIDFKGVDFVEDTTTIVVNLHGAKIRLFRQLIPEQEIRILSRRTGRDGVFRVVGRAGETEVRHSFWGVECTNPGSNIWGIQFPQLGPKDQTSIRVMLQCPDCHVRELLYLDEPLLESIQDLGGLLRGCLTCGKTGLWRQVPYYDA